MGLRFVVLFFCVFGICASKNSFNYRTRELSPKSSSIEYYTKTKDVTIHILIHLDKVLTNKLAKEYGYKTRKKLKNLIESILTEVEEIFHQLSVDQKIRFKLIDTRFLKNKTNVIEMDENATKYLKSYCEWQAEKKMITKKWYYSVLLTGLDLFYVDRSLVKVRTSTGRGYMGGMCSVRKSCTVLEWQPKNIGPILAHEIAHSLGMPHDGPPHNKCKNRGYLMSAQYSPRGHSRNWSPCNRHDLKRYIASRKSWCLRPDFEKNISIEFSKQYS